MAGKVHLSRRRRVPVDEAHWLTVSDLMSGLMVIFLFVAISYMRVVVGQRDLVAIERDRIKQVIVAWDQTQDAVYRALEEEFREDLTRWNAEIVRQDLMVRFREPEVLFERGKDTLQPRFQEILGDFFPRYVRRLDEFSHCDPLPNGKPRGCIEEVRIEGHTSSEWNERVPPEEAYFNNMALSQDRTRSVLRYCHSLPGVSRYAWLEQRIAAVGFSSAHLILDAQGQEDRERSRRVEFRVKTTIEKQLMKIIQEP
jgi:outer membrane protein OmpA-like peptidoglycan-associated protein